MPRFTRRTELPFSPEEVFAWHKRTGAFERLSPPWVDVTVLHREGGIHDGGRVVLGIRQGPAKIKWEVKHTEFQEGSLFRDEQVSGPFKSWTHHHRFLPGEDGGCIMEDDVEWEAPLGGTSLPFAESYLMGELDRLFTFRHTRLLNDLTLHARHSGPPLTVAITGATGLIGSSLAHFLTTGGHRVIRMVRGRGDPGEDAILWSPGEGHLDREGLEGVDAVVHLAGESLSALRWTSEKKDRIHRSRVQGTDLLAKTLARMTRPPSVLISGSAVGIYGNRGRDVLNEESKTGKGFLARVCKDWEAATSAAVRAGIRVVKLRTGFVITPQGPGLGKMLTPFRAGLGGRIGSGRQYMSWIDLDDETGLIHHALTKPGVSGPFNATAPHPVPNNTFTDTLGRVLGRPTLLPVPSLAIKAALGELGDELLLQGARVLPRKAQETGYEFLFPSLEDSLRHQLGRAE
jgi:uncharacterized protein (TIGR01777 family)